MTDIILTPADDIQQKAKLAKPGDRILLKAGVYRNSDWGKPFTNRTKGSLALISLKGTPTAPITIRPYESDRVTIESDVTAFALKNCEWLNIEDIEFKGCTNSIKFEEAIALWWLTDCRLWQTSANGISINTCFNINIRNCVIHQWPGSGINHNYGEYIVVEDCIIGHCARWSVGGVHAFANSKPGSGLRTNENDVKMASRRNLIIDAQQCIPSRVTAKGFADLGLDEGAGLHSQAQSSVAPDGGVVFGKWEITNNLVMFCGKSAINANGTGNLLIERNSLYQNVQNTVAADILVSPPKETDITASMPVPVVKNNLIHSLPTARSLHRFGDETQRYLGFGANYLTEGVPMNADFVANTEAIEVAAVFQDPAANDFRKHPSIPDGFGAPDAIVQALVAKAQSYGISLSPCPVRTDGDYLAIVKQKIFDSWPDPATIPEFGAGFVLKDPVTLYEYSYGDRLKYPNNPKP